MTEPAIPEHIPSDLVRNYDFFDMGDEADIFLKFKELHSEPDIFYTPCNGGHWVVTRYEDMDYIFSNPKEFSSRHQTLPKKPITITMLEFDGGIHRDFRRLLTPFFSPKSVGDLEKISRDLTNTLIDDFYAKGECDFVSEFTQKMPIMILMSLLDLPSDDVAYLLEISQNVVHSGNPEVQKAAIDRLADYMATHVIPERRANPGNDIFSAVIVGAVEDGRAVTDEELIGLGTLLIVAGLDTVAAMLGFVTKFLAENSGHRKQLANDPDLINDALEEMMRRHHLSNLARVAACDLEIKGVQMKAGDSILLPTTVAGLDERRYKDAMTVDFKRGDKRTLVFGRGPHQCIGAFLARTEIRAFLREWFKRIPDFEIKAGEKPISHTGTGNSVHYLPLTWNVA